MYSRKSTIIWFIGYIFTWMSKWVIYDILYKEGLIKSAIMQVFYRTTSALQILEKLKMFLFGIIICIKNIVIVKKNEKIKKS